MNLTLPRYGNHFHPAWLLLPMPPLVAIALQWFDDNEAEFLILGLRAILLGVLVGVMATLRFHGGAGPGLRLLKEMRQQLPGALLALLVPGVFAWSGSDSAVPWALGSFALGCLLLGANAFGAEFEQRTLAGLLAQPISRARLYLEKLGVAAVLILLAALNLALALAPEAGFGSARGGVLQVMVVALLAVASGPLFSLLGRSTLAGAVFTATVPLVLALGSIFLLQLAHELAFPNETMPSVWPLRLVTWAAPFYLLTTAILSWRTFARLQVHDSGGRTTQAWHPLSRPVDGLFRRLLPERHPMASLLRKELRLQVAPWLVAGIMVLLSVLVWLLRSWADPESSLARSLNDASLLAVFAGLLGTLALVVAGAACVAEERELGTFEWQLTQPVTLARQWLVKLGVATLVALTFGVLLPAGLLWLSFEPETFSRASGEVHPLAFTTYTTCFLLLFVVSVYASSISRSTMRATASTVFIAGGISAWVSLFFVGAGEWLSQRMREQQDSWTGQINPPAWAPSPELFSTLGLFAVVLNGLLLALPLLAFAGANARRLRVAPAAVARQLGGMIAGLTLVLAVEIVFLSQLVLLQTQADRATSQAELKDEAIRQIRKAQASGLFTPEIASRFAAAPTDPPEAIVANLIGREGFDALASVQTRIHQAAPSHTGAGSPFRMSPGMAGRYGLLPPESQTNAASSRTGTLRTNPVAPNR
jgi:ABC-type transport system involved in multi-copper enzyme maturation permease subunit